MKVLACAGKQLIGKDLTPENDKARLHALELYLQAVCDTAQGVECAMIIDEFFETDPARRVKSVEKTATRIEQAVVQNCVECASLRAAVRHRDEELARLSNEIDSLRRDARRAQELEAARSDEMQQLIASLKPKLLRATWTAIARWFCNLERNKMHVAWRKWNRAVKGSTTLRYNVEANFSRKVEEDLIGKISKLEREAAAAAAELATRSDVWLEEQSKTEREFTAIRKSAEEFEVRLNAAEAELTQERIRQKDTIEMAVAEERARAREAAEIMRREHERRERAHSETLEATRQMLLAAATEAREASEHELEILRKEASKYKDGAKAKGSAREQLTSSRVTELEREVAEATVRQDAYERECEELRVERTRLQAELDGACSRQAAKDALSRVDALNDMRAELDDRTNDVRQLQETLGARECELVAAHSQLRAIVLERDKLSTEISAVQASASKELDAAAATAETNENALAASRADAAALQNELSAMQTRFDEAIQMNTELVGKRRGDIDTFCSEADRERATLCAQSAMHLNEIKKLRRNIAEYEEREAASKKCAAANDVALRCDLRTARDALATTDAELSILRLENANLRTEFDKEKAKRGADQLLHAKVLAELRADFDSQRAKLEWDSSQANTRLDSANSLVRGLRSRLSDVTAAEHVAKCAIGESQLQLNEEQAREDAQLKLAEAECALETAKQDLATLRAEHERVLQTSASAELKIDRNDDRIAECQRQLESAMSEGAQLKAELSQAEMQHSMEIGEIRARVAAAVAERDVALARATRLESELKLREAATEAFEDARESLVAGLRKDLANEVEAREHVEGQLAGALAREQSNNAADRAFVKAEIAALRADIAARGPVATQFEINTTGDIEKLVCNPSADEVRASRVHVSREISALIDKQERERMELEARERDLVNYTAELRAALDAVGSQPTASARHILPPIPKSLVREQFPRRNGANFLGLKTISDVALRAASPLSLLWMHHSHVQVDDVAARIRNAANVVMTNSNLGLAMTYLRDEEDEKQNDLDQNGDRRAHISDRLEEDVEAISTEAR